MALFGRVPLLLALVWSAAHAAGSYVGSEACAPCHQNEYDRHVRSRHANALRPILQSPVANILLHSQQRDAVLHYEAREDGIAVIVALGGEEVAAKLEWAFGAGAQGITPVGRLGSRFFESRVSYYPVAGRLATTFGHPARAENPRAILGLLQSSHTITSCFGCHATNVGAGVDGPDLSEMQRGVQCERCHGPGQQHVAVAKAGGTRAELRTTVVNPGRFSAKAEVEICGQCHRLPAAGDASPAPELEDPVMVRFAPIGLMASRCFIASRKLACSTCHDAHENARTDVLYYSNRCAGCHNDAPKPGSSCRRAAKQDCRPCHMRQASVGPYLKFTDHRIRVY